MMKRLIVKNVKLNNFVFFYIYFAASHVLNCICTWWSGTHVVTSRRLVLIFPWASFKFSNLPTIKFMSQFVQRLFCNLTVTIHVCGGTICACVCVCHFWDTTNIPGSIHTHTHAQQIHAHEHHHFQKIKVKKHLFHYLIVAVIASECALGCIFHILNGLIRKKSGNHLLV